MDTIFDTALAQPKAAWSALLAMALCVAVLITSEFMPVSLLTPIANGLGISEGRAGQAISISGAFTVVTSLVIAARTLSDEAGGGLQVAIIQVAITLGAAIGGLLFDAFGWRSPLALSVALLFGAALAAAGAAFDQWRIMR